MGLERPNFKIIAMLIHNTKYLIYGGLDYFTFIIECYELVNGLFQI
jgi:hypothetical protein